MYREELEKLCRRRCGLCQLKWKEFQERYVARANGKLEQICRKGCLETELCEAGHHILNSSCSKQIFVVDSSGGAFQVPYRKQ